VTADLRIRVEVRPDREGFEVSTVRTRDGIARRSSAVTYRAPETALETAEARRVFFARVYGVSAVSVWVDPMIGGPE
jgi:hypothetical protein